MQKKTLLTIFFSILFWSCGPKDIRPNQDFPTQEEIQKGKDLAKLVGKFTSENPKDYIWKIRDTWSDSLYAKFVFKVGTPLAENPTELKVEFISQEEWTIHFEKPIANQLGFSKKNGKLFAIQKEGTKEIDDSTAELYCESLVVYLSSLYEIPRMNRIAFVREDDADDYLFASKNQFSANKETDQYILGISKKFQYPVGAQFTYRKVFQSYVGYLQYTTDLVDDILVLKSIQVKDSEEESGFVHSLEILSKVKK